MSAAEQTSRWILEIDGETVVVSMTTERPAVLAVHGYKSTGLKSFSAFAEHLQPHGIGVIAPDLPGFGGSTPPITEWLPDDVYSLDRYADFLDTMAAEFNLPRPAILGHSMGAKIALAAAVRHPDRFGPIILVNPGGFSPWEKLLGRVGSWDLWYRMLENPTARALAAHTPFASFVGDRKSVAGLRSFRHAHRGMDLGLSGIRSQIGGIDKPVLLLWGSDDSVLPRSTPARVARVVPGLNIQYIAGAGHTPMMEQPESTAAAVAAFLVGVGYVSGDNSDSAAGSVA